MLNEALSAVSARWRHGYRYYKILAGGDGRRSGWTATTDGHRVFRALGRHLTKEQRCPSELMLPVMEQFDAPKRRVGKISLSRLADWARTAVTLCCAECGETGAATDVECRACSGTGLDECYACGHVHECEACDGRGDVSCEAHMCSTMLVPAEPSDVGKIAGVSIDRRLLTDVLDALMIEMWLPAVDVDVYACRAFHSEDSVMFVGRDWQLIVMATMAHPGHPALELEETT